MKEKTAIEKMVEWLEAQIHKYNNNGQSIAGDMMAYDKGFYRDLEEARRLASLEAKEKPTKCEHMNNKAECHRRCPSLCPSNTDNDCNIIQPKPTANAALVGELREWINNRELYVQDYDGNPTVVSMEFAKAQEEVEEILSRYSKEAK